MKRPSRDNVIPFKSVRSSRLALPFSVSREMKAAQISCFPAFEGVEPLPIKSWAELPVFAPNILVGYSYDLQRLAEKTMRGEITVRSVDHAIFALTDCGSNPISDVLRVTLWQVFGVPVYELIVAPGYRLLASECEAHDGWHVATDTSVYLASGELLYDALPAKRLHSGFSCEIEASPCGCGRQSLRVKDLSPTLPGRNDRPIGVAA